MINPMDLTGKHIVVTGASSGIGRATCIQASKLGAKVSLIARNEAKLQETILLMDCNEKHSYYSYYSYDLNDIAGINSLIKKISDHDGKIDGLVHSAGFISDRPIKLDTPEAVASMMRVHYFAFVELIRALASTVKKRSNNTPPPKHGDRSETRDQNIETLQDTRPQNTTPLVNSVSPENSASPVDPISSISCVGVSSTAAICGNKAQGAYSAAKGAMNAVVHPYAKELISKGIRVNTIAFGMVETDMYQRFLDVGGNNDLLKKQYLGIIPVEYAANVICFLLSDASKYITGETLNYDAGILSY